MGLSPKPLNPLRAYRPKRPGLLERTSPDTRVGVRTCMGSSYPAAPPRVLAHRRMPCQPHSAASGYASTPPERGWPSATRNTPLAVSQLPPVTATSSWTLRIRLPRARQPCQPAGRAGWIMGAVESVQWALLTARPADCPYQPAGAVPHGQ